MWDHLLNLSTEINKDRLNLVARWLRSLSPSFKEYHKEKKPEILDMPPHLNMMTSKALCRLLVQRGFKV